MTRYLFEDLPRADALALEAQTQVLRWHHHIDIRIATMLYEHGRDLTHVEIVAPANEPLVAALVAQAGGREVWPSI